MDTNEQYIVFDETANLYLKGYKHHEPVWTDEKKQAAKYNEMDALKQQRRIDEIFSPVHVIKLIGIEAG